MQPSNVTLRNACRVRINIRNLVAKSGGNEFVTAVAGKSMKQASYSVKLRAVKFLLKLHAK